jgi:hypothetical protein
VPGPLYQATGGRLFALVHDHDEELGLAPERIGGLDLRVVA